jgi:hypothetical protein
MNASSNHLQAQLDRLVDGELSPAEYRSLLASLDDQPDGWRRCALAFLEAQALGQDLSAQRSAAGATPAPAPSAAPVAQLPPDRAGDWSNRTWQGLYFATIAASLALAFYVGSWTADINDPSGAYLAENQPAPSAESQNQTSPPVMQAESPEPRALARNDQPLGNVQLVMDGADSPQRVEVPFYGQEQIDHWRDSNKPALSPQVIEQLRQAGHKVDHDEQWILIDTGDGRQVQVPVDNYRIQPPRRPAY